MAVSWCNVRQTALLSIISVAIITTTRWAYFNQNVDCPVKWWYLYCLFFDRCSNYYYFLSVHYFLSITFFDSQILSDFANCTWCQHLSVIRFSPGGTRACSHHTLIMTVERPLLCMQILYLYYSAVWLVQIDDHNLLKIETIYLQCKESVCCSTYVRLCCLQSAECTLCHCFTVVAARRCASTSTC